jgi:hypothetical protein
VICEHTNALDGNPPTTRFPAGADSRYFTLEGYRKIILRAQGLHYRIVCFRDFEMPADRPVLLLRHDLDHPLKGAEALGRIEAELGISSTYFVQTACDFYNLLSKESRQIIRQLVEQGHEIGLHYEAERYLTEEGQKNLASDLRLLEDLSGQPIVSAAEHIPIDGYRIALSGHIRNEAYESRFTGYPMTYISDSLMVWRQYTPHDLLDARASFQFLSHPDTWVSNYGSMENALSDMVQCEIGVLRARYAEVANYYAQLLVERRQRDEDFHKRRIKPAEAIGGRLRQPRQRRSHNFAAA